ncbi:MAG: hypothetical protein JSR26_03560 [Proteobacteria bacterium]|nr:hypothetical protein [Pseudomonadota bacterium]
MHELACVHCIANLSLQSDPANHGDRLIWLYDMHLLACAMTPQDFDGLVRLTAERGLAGACLDGLRRTHEAFATPLPEGLLETLETQSRLESFDVNRAQSRAYQEWHNLRALPLRQRFAWVQEKLFPSATYMRAQHGAEGKAGLAFAYLRRLGNGLRMALFARH